MVKVIAPGREAIVLKEGAEDDEFWAALGGKGPVNKEDDGVTAAMNRPVLEPRLFHCKFLKVLHNSELLKFSTSKYHQMCHIERI